MAKTNVLISFSVTTKLICVFVFAYEKRLFSYDTAHFGHLRIMSRGSSDRTEVHIRSHDFCKSIHASKYLKRKAPYKKGKVSGKIII